MLITFWLSLKTVALKCVLLRLVNSFFFFLIGYYVSASHLLHGWLFVNNKTMPGIKIQSDVSNSCSSVTFLFDMTINQSDCYIAGPISFMYQTKRYFEWPCSFTFSKEISMWTINMFTTGTKQTNWTEILSTLFVIMQITVSPTKAFCWHKSHIRLVSILSDWRVICLKCITRLTNFKFS